MTTRINNDMRDEITNAAILHRFKADAEELCDIHAQIATDIYNDAYSDDLDRINGLPEGWLPTANHITVNCGGERHALYFNGEISRYGNYGFPNIMRHIKREPVARRVLAKDDTFTRFAVYGATSPVARRVDKFQARLSAFNERVIDTQRKVRTTLDKFHTVEKLIAEWPEIEPFIPEKKKPVQLPAVPTKALNTLLDLPVEAV